MPLSSDGRIENIYFLLDRVQYERSCPEIGQKNPASRFYPPVQPIYQRLGRPLGFTYGQDVYSTAWPATKGRCFIVRPAITNRSRLETAA